MAEFQKIKGGPIRLRPVPSAKDLAEGRAHAAKLSFAKIWKKSKIEPGALVRLDGQGKGPDADSANLQIQINDQKRSPTGGTTIAGVIVDGKLRDFGATDHAEDQKKIVACIIQALYASLSDGCNYTVKLR